MRVAAGLDSIGIEKNRYSAFTADVAADVDGQPDEPWFKGPCRIELVQKPECTHEHLLRSVLRIFSAPEEPPREVQHPPLVPDNDLLEGGNVSGDRAGKNLDEFPFFFGSNTRHP